MVCLVSAGNTFLFDGTLLVVTFMQVKLCGHATLAAAHFLFVYGLVSSDVIEFSTLSGILTAKRVPETKALDPSNHQNGNARESFLIELDFPVVSITKFDGADEVSTISKSLSGAAVIEIHKTTASDDLLVCFPLTLNFNYCCCITEFLKSEQQASFLPYVHISNIVNNVVDNEIKMVFYL